MEAVNYYREILNELAKNNMTPVVTLFHFDMPISISKMGGWTNPLVIDYFVDYATFAFKTFGDLVKVWITMNEPGAVCPVCYATAYGPPGMNVSGIADYQCGHNFLLAHAAVYFAYHSMKDISDGGKLGVTLGFDIYYPKNNWSLSDQLAAKVGNDFTFGWFANPLIGSGDYPITMRTRIDLLSLKEGYKRSRLPRFTKEQILFVKGATDFVGINHYSSRLASFHGPVPIFGNTDSGVVTTIDPTWQKTNQEGFEYVPWGFGHMLRYVRDTYNNPYVIVTENGYAGFPDEDIDCDPAREQWFKNYLAEMLKAIQDGCNVHGYFVWSLLDSFEWQYGYTVKFGVTYVDFDDDRRKRKVKGIGRFFKNVMKDGLPIPNS